MPTQSKKSMSITPTDRPAKLKKKKKKESGSNSRNSFSKTSTSGVDNSIEGTHLKSRTKSRSDTSDVTEGLGKVASEVSSKSFSSRTENTSSSNWRRSSSDGRSTSSSGENFGSSTSATSGLGTRDNEVNNLTTRLELTRVNESLRWDLTDCDDPDEEEERLRIYKLHRRKRYMDFFHKRSGGEGQSSQFHG